MRRITVWADEHTAGRCVRALEEIGVDYMSEAYVPPAMPPHRVKPETTEAEPPVGAIALLRPRMKDIAPPLWVQIMKTLGREPLTLEELSALLLHGHHGPLKKIITSRSLAACLAVLTRDNRIQKRGNKFHVCEPE